MTASEIHSVSKKSTKTLFITQHRIIDEATENKEEFPVGKVEREKFILYSGKKEKLIENIDQIIKDLAKTQKAFIYLGLHYEYLQPIIKVIENKKIKITFISCACDKQEKEEFVKVHGGNILFSELCGGTKEFEELIIRKPH